MQCPKCGHEPTMAEMQRSPNDCVNCGINYAGYARALKQQVDDPKPIKVGPTRVIVEDINMSFWSMVKFMVKWAIAAIPAALILVAIVAFVAASISALRDSMTIGWFGRTAETPFTPADIKTDDPAQQVRLVDLYRDGRYMEGVVRTQFADGVTSFSRFSVDCGSGTGVVTSVGMTLESMRRLQKTPGYERIQAGTPRFHLARKMCEHESSTVAFLK